MVLFQFILLTGLLHCSLQAAPDDSAGIRLYNSYMKKCLKHDLSSSSPTRPRGEDCDLADPSQEWRWVDNLFLQNVGTGQCVTAISSDVFFKMRDCVIGSNNQRLICSFNQIIGSERGQNGGVKVGMNSNFLLSGNTSPQKTKWEVHGAANEMSICNRQSFREHRKWRRLASKGMDVASGLNTWIVIGKTEASPSSDNLWFTDDAGNTWHKIPGALSTISIAPHALWGLQEINDNHMLWTKQEKTSWNDMAAGYGFLDFSVPGKGFFTQKLGTICTRLGITEILPSGNNWHCSPMPEILQDFSCGVTGCFAIIDGTLHYREGIDTTNVVGLAWAPIASPKYELFTKLAAGPVYDIWAITEDGYPYRRLGVTDGIPMGTTWEFIPDILLLDVSFGIYGPVGINKHTNEIIILNGSPTAKRQRELDDWCTTTELACNNPDSLNCPSNGPLCNARFTPKARDKNYQWRCLNDLALGEDGQVWIPQGICLFSPQHSNLLPLAMRSPVLGDFEKQMWLDQACQDPEMNPNMTACSDPYFANYDQNSQELVCRTTHPSPTCPTSIGLHEKLFRFTTGSCTDMPLLRYLASSSFSSSKSDTSHDVKLERVGKAFCVKAHKVDADEYVQIDFLFLHKICAIATMGLDPNFVDSYRVSYSLDNENWNMSSIFGTTFEFPGNVDATNLVKRYLPAPVEARYLRVHFISIPTATKCLQLEIYGSSKETEATSCGHYKDHLFATLDGFYNIYQEDKKRKERVFCKGITDLVQPTEPFPHEELVDPELIGCFRDEEVSRAMPELFIVSSENCVDECQAIAVARGYEVFGVQFVVECFTGPQAQNTYYKHGEASNCVDGKGGGHANSVYRIRKADKLFWALNRSRDGSLAPLKHGRHAVQVFQSSKQRPLAQFPNHCFTYASICDKGQSLEFWLWFTYSTVHMRTTVIRSGILNDLAQGFRIYLQYHHVCMEIHFERKMIRSCVGPLGKPAYWVHVLAFWDIETGLTVIVDDLAFRSHSIRSSRYSAVFEDRDSVLRLGSPYEGLAKAYEVAIHSLTIWNRKLTQNEVETIFTKGYTMASEDETCKATCEAKQLTCCPDMNANLANVLKRLGILCASVAPYNAQDSSQPYVALDGVCHGLDGLNKTSCDVSKVGVRRLCRCERPVHGVFSEWSQWSFCSRTCGSGRRVRTRSCTHPAPRLGGRECDGITSIHEDCQELPCGVRYGILHDVWLGNPNLRFSKAMQINRFRTFSSFLPTFTHVLENFTMMNTNFSNYGERYRTFFIPPQDGSYTFTMECPHACLLEFKKKYFAPKRLIDVQNGPVTISTPVQDNLIAGKPYYILIYSVYNDDSGQFSLGFKNQDTGLIKHPITKEYLTWKEPDLRGILREVWDSRLLSIKSNLELEAFLQDAPEPAFTEVLLDFETGKSGQYYVERLSTYFLATQNGDYNFYMSCMAKCYLYIDSSYEYHAEYVDTINIWTGGSWRSKALEGGRFYHVIVLHWQLDSTDDYVGFGVTLPDGTQLLPLDGKYLWPEIPEKSEIEKRIVQKSTTLAATYATDGLSSSCSLTTATTDPWLTVETLWSILVYSVAITNQITNPSHLDNVVIRVGNSYPQEYPLRNKLCYGPIAHVTAGETIAFPCTTQLLGKYIVVHVHGSDIILSVCEIAVYGERNQVQKVKYAQGQNDGRVENYQITSSSSLPRHEAFNARLYHPFSSWCGKEEVDMIWEVQFIEAKSILAFAAQGHPMEIKYVNQARLKALNSENIWIEMRDKSNGKDLFNLGLFTVVVRFKQTHFTKSIRFSPVKWVHIPCVRLAFMGAQSANSFAWEFSRKENSIGVKLSGAETTVKLNAKPGLFIPKSSPLGLSGFNSRCFWDPKSCHGSFNFGFMVTFKDIASDGMIFSTTGYNTSVVGTSLFLEGSNLVVNIRTVSRIWKVSAPASGDATTFGYVEIAWYYNENVKLTVGGVTYSEPYTVVAHMPMPADDWNGVIKFGGVDLSLSWVKFDIAESYSIWVKKGIHQAVDGFHTEWSPWGYCSQSCGASGVHYRYRRCLNPPPKFNGLECPEQELTETRPCPKPSCDDDDGILRQVWMNKPPTEFSLANVFLGYASHLEVVANFSLTYNDGPFAERFRTFLRPSESGEFVFEMSCEYHCELWVSPTDEADEKVKILSHDASGDADRTVRTVTAKSNFETGDNYYVEVRSFEVKGTREHTLLAIKAPNAAVPGTGFSLVRHKPDCYHGLGMESGALPDGLMFSRKFLVNGPFSYHGRLNGPFPFIAKRFNDYVFFVDLLELHWIVAVAIQGYKKDDIDGRIAKLYVKTMLDTQESGIAYLDGVSTSHFGNDDPWEIKMINLTQPTRSRYVRIWMQSYYGDGCFRMDVYGRHAGNLAYKKGTMHQKAVDSSYGRHWKNCVILKTVNNNVWWLLDLARPYYVGEVFIVPRKDCCFQRMHDLVVRIGNSDVDGGSLNAQCGGLHSMYLPQVLPSLSVHCESQGRYLTIARYNTDVSDITLCEVAVFQIENDTIFSNWSECSVTCGHGFQQRHTICIKPYYCKSVEEMRPCAAEMECEILMQNCGQLKALGETKTGKYKVRPDPAIENDIYIYCDHDTDDGGWLVLQRRDAGGSLDMTQPWDIYRDGFGNVSTEFWIGNKYLSQLTNHTAYEILFVFKLANETILKKTKCDAFNVSSEEENYRLQLGTCEGPDAEVLTHSNWTEFSTIDRDNGLSGLNCGSEITGWWFGSCDSYINGKTMSCFGLTSCDYEVTMMIKPNKVHGGWTHWTTWETCDKPCGGGNSSRVRSCTHPPPTGGGDDCEGPWNKTRGCHTNPCPVIEVNITMTFTEEIWDGDLLSLTSSLFDEMLQKISNNIKALYDDDPLISVVVNSLRQGSVIADVTILYEALDGQQLIVLQEDLDQDGLLNQNMPVVYSQSEIFVSEVLFGPPEITELVNTSSTSIYIKWQPPNSTVLYKIKGYRIFYKKTNDTSLTMLVKAVDRNVFEIEITDLEMYTNYSIRVSAFSLAGNGVPTKAHVVITDEDVPITAPVITSAYNLSSTSLNVSWLPVDLPLFRGVPTGYVLFYRIKTEDNTTAFLNTTIDMVTSTNISDLMKYTEYEMYMTATTIKGEGIRGDFVYYRTDEDVPSHAPDNITLQKNTSTSLLISWSAIPQQYVHGVLRGYIIQYWPVDDVNDTTNATVGPGETEIELKNLIKFTNYTIKFAGLTYKGIGNWSEVMLQTDEDIPDRGPDDLSGFNLSTTAINVSWGLIPKYYRHGIIIGYRVYYDDNKKFSHSDSVTLPASQRTVILRDLRSYTEYNISIAGLTRIGEGWNRTFVLIRTNPGAPTRAPWELMCSGISSYTISLYWYRFISDLTGSLLTGYFLSYRAIYPPDPVIHNVTLEAFKYNYVAKELKGFTNYSFELYVFNPWGRSNTSLIYCFTEEGKPLVSPSNLAATSRLSPDKVYLTWDAVPFNEMAGIARGYTVTYRKTKEAGESVDEEEKRVNIFDPHQTEIMIEGLDSYSTYSFAIRVFNGMLSGDDSEKIYAETCNCLEDFYTNWCSYLPYVNTSNSGIFPPLIRSAIYGVCGNCSEYGMPKIHFDTDIRGSLAKKNGLVQVKKSITEDSQISFPVIGRKDSKTFLPIIDSPGSVFVTKKPGLTMVVEYAFLGTIIGTLPLLGFAVLTAYLAGLIMWGLESKKNPEHFPRRFIRGASEGFWWSFISMTTVGYGDRAPITIPGRLFALIWTLYGLIITGLVVGNLTSALTASVAFSVNEVNLYRAKIAAIENSSEFKLGLSKGAYVNKGRNYSDILTVLHAVEVGSVEGALLDMYVIASRPELQRKDSPLMVKSIIQNPSVYGMELAGHAEKLRAPFLHYLQNNAALVSSKLEEYTNPVKETEEDIDTEALEGDDINVLASDSPIIKLPLLYSSIALILAVVLGLISHFALCRRRKSRKAFLRNDTAVSPVSDSAELRDAMDNHIKQFCENSKITITEIKHRHRTELRKFTK